MWAKAAMRLKKPPLKLQASIEFEIQTLMREESKEVEKIPRNPIQSKVD
jgi:hypothetical protein